MFWAATMKRAAYDPETISMLSSVLERAIAALPREQRTEDGKTRLASSFLAAAARGERDPIQLYAAALVAGAWEPSMGEHLPPHHLSPGGPMLMAASAPWGCWEVGPCPAMPNGRCRMHDGLSTGAPKGNKTGVTRPTLSRAGDRSRY